MADLESKMQEIAEEAMHHPALRRSRRYASAIEHIASYREGDGWTCEAKEIIGYSGGIRASSWKQKGNLQIESQLPEFQNGSKDFSWKVANNL